MPASVSHGGEKPPLREVGLGIVNSEISPDRVDQVIEATGCRAQRQRLLSVRVVVYFVIVLCLFSGADSSRAAACWLARAR